MTETEAKSALSDYGVSRETLDRLEAYVALLDEWRQRINLIGPNEIGHVWARHILDCAQLLPMVGEAAEVVDLGSGAGLPGLVLGCAAVERDGRVTMIESVGKKCAFLADVTAKLSLPVRILNKRVESVSPEPASFVTARAFAPMPRLLDYAAPWIDRGATGLFFKGERWREELTEASECWTLAYEAIPSRTRDTGVILKIKEAKRV